MAISRALFKTKYTFNFFLLSDDGDYNTVLEQRVATIPWFGRFSRHFRREQIRSALADEFSSFDGTLFTLQLLSHKVWRARSAGALPVNSTLNILSEQGQHGTAEFSSV